jgi:AcrR family transcriptional regulator
MAVSRETIVDASLKILNRDGAEGLSMRTLAKELNIKAASLYWHFKGKQELYGEIMERMCQGFELPDTALPPLEYLTEAHKSYRQMLLAVHDSSVIAENSIPNTPRRVEFIRGISNKLLEMGVTPKNLMTVSNMLNNYVLSFVADEVRFLNTPPETLKSFSEMLAPSDEVMFMSQRNFDEQFLYGLEVLFAGLIIKNQENKKAQLYN